jgi:peptidoglycan/xylan/chitin deacetylase (PgdA/CDA1 family)
MTATEPGSAVILMYHRVDAAGAEPVEGDFALPTELFEDHVRRLADLGVVRPLAALEGPPPPGRSVVLTFDDGCDTDVTVALPCLLERGLSAAFFVNPARVGTAGRVDWEGLRALVDARMTVGSHGLDHTLLDDLSDEELERQLALSRERLEDGLGRPVDALSLPGGTGGSRAVRLARRLGYRLVLGSRPAPFRRPRRDAPLPRFAVRRGHDATWVERVARQEARVLLAARARHAVTVLARGALGTTRYERWRDRWTRAREGSSGEASR